MIAKEHKIANPPGKTSKHGRVLQQLQSSAEEKK
jgi:hypothetical protein